MTGIHKVLNKKKRKSEYKNTEYMMIPNGFILLHVKIIKVSMNFTLFINARKVISH